MTGVESVWELWLSLWNTFTNFITVLNTPIVEAIEIGFQDVLGWTIDIPWESQITPLYLMSTGGIYLAVVLGIMAFFVGCAKTIIQWW